MPRVSRVAGGLITARLRRGTRTVPGRPRAAAATALSGVQLGSADAAATKSLHAIATAHQKFVAGSPRQAQSCMPLAAEQPGLCYCVHLRCLPLYKLALLHPR